MASGGNLTDIITCCLCMEKYDDDKRVPKGLPCFHNFCLTCLKSYVVSKIDGNKIRCPLCQKEFCVPREGIAGLPINYAVKHLLDHITASNEKTKIACSDHQGKVCEHICTVCITPLCSICMRDLATDQATSLTLQA